MKLPQLSLRDLFWLVLVAALIVGWWQTAADRARLIERERQRAAELVAERERQQLLDLEIGWKDRFAAEQQRRHNEADSQRVMP